MNRLHSYTSGYFLKKFGMFHLAGKGVYTFLCERDNNGNADDTDWADLRGQSVKIRPIRVIRVPILLASGGW